MAIVSSTWPPKRSASDAGADALARRVDRRRRAGRAAADDEHVEGVLGVELRRVARGGAGVELGDDLLEAHAALRRTARRSGRRSARP